MMRPAPAEKLAGGEGDGEGGGEAGVVGYVLRTERLLDQEGVVVHQRAQSAQGRGEVLPGVVGVEEQCVIRAARPTRRGDASGVEARCHATDLDLDGVDAGIDVALNLLAENGRA